MNNETHMTLTANVAAAYLSNHATAISDVPLLIGNIASALTGLGEKPADVGPVYEPAVDPKRSIKPDYLISLIDGRHYKMLRRHLSLNGLTPDQYRERYGLRPDYPMTCATYSERRRTLAIDSGLGRHANGGRRKKAA